MKRRMNGKGKAATLQQQLRHTHPGTGCGMAPNDIKIHPDHNAKQTPSLTPARSRQPRGQPETSHPTSSPPNGTQSATNNTATTKQRPTQHPDYTRAYKLTGHPRWHTHLSTRRLNHATHNTDTRETPPLHTTPPTALQECTPETSREPTPRTPRRLPPQCTTPKQKHHPQPQTTANSPEPSHSTLNRFGFGRDSII